MSKFLITLTGPSCSGKTTLENHLIKNNIAKRLCGYTTREPRKGEVDGVDVNFIDFEEGKKLHSSPDTVQKLHFKGHYYGKTSQEIQALFEKTSVAVCVIEPTGLEQLKSYVDQRSDITMLAYFVTTSTDQLIQRMLTRIRDQEDCNVEYYAKRMRDLIIKEIYWGSAYNAYRETLLSESEQDIRDNAQMIANDIDALRCAQL